MPTPTIIEIKDTDKGWDITVNGEVIKVNSKNGVTVVPKRYSHLEEFFWELVNYHVGNY